MKKFLAVAALVVLVGLTLFGFLAYSWTYSEGYRVGTLIKFSHKGYVFKTWEGQIDQGFLVPADQDPETPAGVATRLWDFSVHDSDVQVREQLDKAIARNRRVKLYYEEMLWQVFFWGDTKYFVTKVDLTD